MQYELQNNKVIEQIISYIDYFSSDAEFGTWQSGGKIEPNVFVAPHCVYDNKVIEFVDFLHKTNFLINFDWSEWDEGRKIATDIKLIEQADLLTLRKLLTAIIRNDRFCEGALLSAIEDGLIKAILVRLKEIGLVS